MRHEIVVYPDADHGFFCDQRATYNEAAAKNAWERVKTLFAEELRQLAAQEARRPCDLARLRHSALRDFAHAELAAGEDASQEAWRPMDSLAGCFARSLRRACSTRFLGSRSKRTDLEPAVHPGAPRRATPALAARSSSGWPED
jgi:hypothetical protein